MVTPAVGAVVLVTFPFSDLSASKLRPAVVLAGIERDDWILCQVTSNPYGDAHAIELTDAAFASGSLHHVSYARPGRIFSAHASLMQRSVGALTPHALTRLVDEVIMILRPPPANV